MSGPLRPAPTPKRAKAGWRQVLGGQARKRGHDGEWVAALWLMLKGYQILAFRLKTPGGEIDILARRGRVLAVVEVKRRATLDAALQAIHPRQLRRLRVAGAAVARGRPSLAELDVRLDIVALAPGRIPRHVRGIEATEG